MRASIPSFTGEISGLFMIIDKEGVVRYNKTMPIPQLVPNDELLNVLKGL